MFNIRLYVFSNHVDNDFRSDRVSPMYAHMPVLCSHASVGLAQACPNDAVSVIHSSQHLFSFGGPKVQHSCAMNTQCIQYSYHNYILVSEKRWNSGYIFMKLCVCAREGLEICIIGYSCIIGWTQANIYGQCLCISYKYLQVHVILTASLPWMVILK